MTFEKKIQESCHPQSDDGLNSDLVWNNLDRLTVPVSLGGAGITTQDVANLIESGYATVESIAFTPIKKLMDEVSGIGEMKAKNLKEASRKIVPMGFECATVFLNTRKQMVRLTTGCNALDALLHGGIESGGITEIFGEFRTGKSQLCHTLCVTCQLPIGSGGAGGRALYIDTEGTFRPERIVEISERYGMSANDALTNVVFARAYNSEHQNRLLSEAPKILTQSDARFGLIVIDSATALFRTDYQGRGELADRQQHLGRFLRAIQRLADEFGVAVVITNQVMASVDVGPSASYGHPSSLVKPIGGHIMAHATQTRLFLKKGGGDKRICKVYDSPVLPEGEAPYSIASGGIVDYIEPENSSKRRKTA